ncbi:hypothetical protein V8B97DRAFT_2023523 [Scleroderma yunnanense]
MEDTRYSFTDPFLDHSTDNFSFGQPSSTVDVQDDAMTASKFDSPYVIPHHHSASQHIFPPQNSWEEPLELSGGTMCNADPFEDIDWNNADIQAFLKEALDTTPSAPGGDMTPYHRFTSLPHASVILPPVLAVLTPPANQLLCTTGVSSSHGTMDTLTAGLSPHLLLVAQDITGISQAADNSSWCTHNPGHLALPIHHSEPLTDAQKATCQIANEEWKWKEAALSESVKKLAELGQKIADIAQEHSIAVKKFLKLLTGHINYKKSHEVSFSNALIWAKALEVNAACPLGSKYSLIQLHQMVTEDPSLQNLDDEAKAQLKDELHATWYGTDNAVDFWEDVLKLELDQVMKQFKLWGCSQNKKSLENMQRDCVQLIKTSFCQLVGNQTQLNYNNFDSAIKLKHGINKKGWPEAVPFMNALRANQCYFVKMSSQEHQGFMKDLKVHQESGEIVKPSHKKCSDSRVPHKCKLTKQSGCQLKQTKNGRAAKSCEYISSTEETEDSNEEGMDK